MVAKDIEMRIILLSLCLLLLGCGLGRTKCTSSAECNAGEICGGLGNGPFQCLKACATSADCLECGVITTACVTETVTLPRT